MQLWQLDITASVFLTDGTELKLISGLDDHSRYCVIATVVRRGTARDVCRAFITAMRTYGVPDEVLTDNGKQFTGRFGKPRPAEVLFERICRRNGIRQLLTKPYSPTTTGKVERWHQTLQDEFLDDTGPFATLEEAQAAVDQWGRSTTTSGRISPWTWHVLLISSGPQLALMTAWRCGRRLTSRPSPLRWCQDRLRHR
jgi:transposase InsO family protein